MNFVLDDVIEQHWEEACQLWTLRTSAVHRPNFDLRTLGELDERIEAHLDGLRVAGRHATRICQPLETGGDPAEIFTSGVLALGGRDTSRLQDLVTICEDKPNMACGFASALGWVSADLAEPHILRGLRGERPAERHIAFAGAAIRRLPIGPELDRALTDGDPFARARALRAVGEYGSTRHVGIARQFFKDADVGCRFWAAWSSVLLQKDSEGTRVLAEFAANSGPYQCRAVELLFRTLESARGLALCQELVHMPQVVGHAAAAVADPALVPWLLELVDNSEAQRFAADAIVSITGADMVRDQLRNGTPPRSNTDEPGEDAIGIAVATDFPCPDARAFKTWWSDHSGKFQPGRRYAGGEVISAPALRKTLQTGHQLQRRRAAIELALLNPGAALFETRAPVRGQPRSLAAIN